VGVVWWRSFIPGHCEQRARGAGASAPLLLFGFLLYLSVQLSPSSPTNIELGFPLILTFHMIISYKPMFIFSSFSNTM